MPQFEIAASNLNIEPTSAVSFKADDYVDFLQGGGFDMSAGLEWSGLRFPAARKAGRILAERGLVLTLHESWNEQTVVSSSTQGLDAIKIAAAFPRLDKCYNELEKVQSATGKKLPIVIHPSGQHLGDSEPKRPRQTMRQGVFSEIWYQPTAEWAIGHGIAVDSRDTAAIVEEIIDKQSELGLDRMAVDLHHLQATRNGVRFRNPADLAVALVASDTFGELQVSIRPDFGGPRQELVAATDGRLADTKTGEILTAIAETFPAGRMLRIVSEVAATEIHKQGFSNLSEAHQMINGGIRQIFGHD